MTKMSLVYSFEDCQPSFQKIVSPLGGLAVTARLVLVGCPPWYLGVGHLAPGVGQVVASLVSVHVGPCLSYVDAFSYPSLELQFLPANDFAL